MNLVEQWRKIEQALPAKWGEAQLGLTVSTEEQAARAAALLAPANSGQSGNRISFYVTRTGPGLPPDAIRRLLARIDSEKIKGTLSLAGARQAPPAPVAECRGTPAEAWEAQVAGLPRDWSDVYAEIELDSTDYLEPAALCLAPVNPARHGDTPAFRFRCARRFGYGASPGMVKRCLERLDEAGITGEVRILRALSDTQPVATQGPVWYVGGKSV